MGRLFAWEDVSKEIVLHPYHGAASSIFHVRVLTFIMCRPCMLAKHNPLQINFYCGESFIVQISF